MGEIQAPGFCWTGGRINDEVRKRGVGPGWWPLLDQMDAELRERGMDYQASQVKEKFGGLRAYISCDDPEAFTIELKYEKKSFEVCEECGAPGVMRKERGWYRTRCEQHA